MDYGDLLSSAWRVTWRHKYLWILGLFAYGSGGCSLGGGGPQYSGSPDDLSTLGEAGSVGDPTGALEGVVDFLAGHWTFIAAILIAFLLAGLVLFILSVISTAGLVSGSAEAYTRHPGSGLGRAWSRGVASFWRLLGMWLALVIAVGLIFLIGAAAVGVPLILLVSDGSGIGWATVAFIILGILALVALAVPAAIIIQICVNWATRSLVLKGTGVFASLGAGWRLFRNNVGTSLLVWAITLGLSIAAGLVLLAAGAAVAIPAVLGFIPLLSAQSSVLWVGVGLVAVLGLAVAVLAKAVLTTYFSSYWTIAYLKLTEEGTPSAASAVTTGKPAEE